MASRKVTNRYPRPGERIAPQTLREFLLEPIPEQLRQQAGQPGFKLCDLDETAWDRFPADALEELSQIIIDRVAAYHVRPVFEHRHFPRPAKGIRLEDLRLENRTRRCLLREGFDDDLESLGDRTLGGILSIRAFGPRCLVDLLSALEGSRKRNDDQWADVAGAAGLCGQLTAAAQDLAKLPAATSVPADDPRFGRLIAAIDVEARTAAEVAQRLLSRVEDPPDPPYVAGQVCQLSARIAGMSQLTMEQELIEIFGATPYERNREILIGYYGWEDGRQHTLTEVGKRFGITRERIRQVCAKLTRRHKNAPLLAPVMDRALEMIQQRLPCAADRLETELAQHGWTAVGMSLESVATGAKLLGRPPAFSVVSVAGKRGAGRLAVRPEQADAVLAIVDLVKKEVYFHGLSTVQQIERLASEKCPGRVATALVRETLALLDGFAWLDERSAWFRLRSICKHGLPKTIDKILAVAGEVTVAQMRAAMGRNRRLWKEPPPEGVLLEFCRQTPGVRVEGERMIADPPRAWNKVLTGVEAKLVQILKKHGPVMERGALEDLCVSGGMNRFSFHAFVSWSPVISQLGHSVYGLLGAKVPAQKVRELIQSRRANRLAHRVLDSHGVTDDGKIWLRYRLSKAASTYAVITVPAALKNTVRGRFRLVAPDGGKIGTLATKDGRAWGLGAFLRQRGARIGDQIVLTLDLLERTAMVSWD